MSETYSKVEIDAKLEAVAQRSETARVGVEGRLDRLMDAVAAIGRDLSDLKREARDDSKSLRADVKQDYQNTRNTIVGFALGAGAIVLAIVALAYTQAGNMTTANGNVLAAFGAGQDAKEAEVAAAAAPLPAKFDPQTGKRIEQ